MKILKVKYTSDLVNGMQITSVTECEMPESIAKIRLAHNNALRGGEWLSEEDFNLIYKPKTTEDVRTTIKESGDRANSGAINGIVESLPKRTRKKRGTA